MASNMHKIIELEGKELLKAMKFPFEGNENIVTKWINDCGLSDHILYRDLCLGALNYNSPLYNNVILCEKVMKALEPYLEKFDKFKSHCPKEGEFYGYKFIIADIPHTKWRYLNAFDGGIVKLKIPNDAKRISPYSNSKKCRCDKAFIEEIWWVKIRVANYSYDLEYDLAVDTADSRGKHRITMTYMKNNDGSHMLIYKGNSIYKGTSFIYRTGEMVYSDSFDEDRWNECSHGIHFFMSPKEALNYGLAYIVNNY